MAFTAPRRSLKPREKSFVTYQDPLKILLAIGAPGSKPIASNEREECTLSRTKIRHGSRLTPVEKFPVCGFDSDTMEEEKVRIFYLKKKIIFPFCTLAVFLRPSDESRAIEKGDRIIAFTVRSCLDLLLYRNKIATLCEVTDVQTDESVAKFMLRGIERVRIEKIIRRKHAIYTLHGQNNVEHNEPPIEELRKKSQELVFLLNVEESDRLIAMLNYIVDLNQMTDFISNYFIMEFGKRYQIYKEANLGKRSAILKDTLNKLIHTMNARGKKKIA